MLLTSVFGPFARDDESGSRVINPLELYHNQVTRAQGPFSLRMHHRSWGTMLIQENISAPSTLLDFPTRDSNEAVSARVRDLRRQIERELGGLSRVIDRVAGPVLLWSARREAALYPTGRPLEPPMFVERRHW